MKKRFYVLWIIIFLIGANACTAESKPVSETTIPSIQPTTEITKVTRTCQPTLDDGVSPSYKPNAPERTVVGHGHILTGTVLSSVDCKPIPNAKLEFWPEEAGLGHPDSSRATFFTDQNGQYRFECNLPEHIHVRISAPGYKTIGVNSYHPAGKAEGIFDIVLEPE
ncbi:MAG: carboxypeptidase regulatory-like domain-containing protein [Anaerolineae bacterium]|nr:carboxypeptidase regulatory-like domain-containing protein [Anaerolineae bacterium]